MKAFLPFISLLIPLQCGVTAFFIYLNNLPRIPWEVTIILWYFFLPVSAFCIALIYGYCHLRRGGGAVLAALILSPLPILSHHLALPFANVFTFPPMLLIALLLSLWGEVRGRTLHRRRKKNAPPNNEPSSTL